MKPVLLTIFFTLGLSSSLAQQVAPQKDPAVALREMNERLKEAAEGQADTAARARLDYQIGAEDLLDIAVFEVPELSRTVRVSAAGEISLPLIGSLRVAGMSPLQLELMLKELLRRRYIKDPHVTVFLKEFHSDPVSVMGAVKLPGLYYIQTRKTLVEVLAMAQGLSESSLRVPGRSILITRKARRGAEGNSSGSDASGSGAATSQTSVEALAGSRPAGAGETGPGQAEIVEVPLKELLQSGDPKWNAPVYPGDVVKVVPAGTVYVAGDVNHPGAFHLTDFDNISAIQALALAGGTKRSASQKKAVIIKTDTAGKRTEQKVNLARVLRGQDADVMLGANDILFVPGSMGKESALRAIETGIAITTGLIIYRR